jgi:hypothetical protein
MKLEHIFMLVKGISFIISPSLLQLWRLEKNRFRKRFDMARLSETEPHYIITGGETTNIELKLATPRFTELAKWLCELANSLGIIGVDTTTSLLYK